MKSELIDLGTVTISDDGSYKVPTDSWPDGMTASNAVAATVYSYNAVSPKESFSVVPRWVIGAPGQVITALRVRFFWLS